VDKLLRGLLDGLADAGFFETDGRVTDVTMKKRYAYNGAPGVTVTVRETDGLS
jgi:Holliday junction resolvase RusA-like endonuclease